METELRIAVIGAGHWGPNLIRNFMSNPRCNVTWICEADEKRLATLLAHYDGVKGSTDVNQILSDPEVGAVVICTPTASHYALTKQAIEKGKHVFVEKPLATKFSEALELAELAKTKNRSLMVGHVFLFNPAIQRIKEIVRSGELGQIHYIYSTRTNLGPIRGDVNAFWDLAPHDISVLLYLLDETASEFQGFGRSFINQPIEDVVFARIGFPSGIFANVHVSWLDPKKVRQIVLVGSKKMLIFDDMASDKLTLVDQGVGPQMSEVRVQDTLQTFRKSIREGSVTCPKVAKEEPLKNECEAFVDSVLHGRPQFSDGFFGAQVVRVLEGVTKAMKKETSIQSKTVVREL